MGDAFHEIAEGFALSPAERMGVLAAFAAYERHPDTYMWVDVPESRCGEPAGVTVCKPVIPIDLARAVFAADQAAYVARSLAESPTIERFLELDPAGRPVVAGGFLEFLCAGALTGAFVAYPRAPGADIDIFVGGIRQADIDHFSTPHWRCRGFVVDLLHFGPAQLVSVNAPVPELLVARFDAAHVQVFLRQNRNLRVEASASAVVAWQTRLTSGLFGLTMSPARHWKTTQILGYRLAGGDGAADLHDNEIVPLHDEAGPVCDDKPGAGECVARRIAGQILFLAEEYLNACEKKIAAAEALERDPPSLGDAWADAWEPRCLYPRRVASPRVASPRVASPRVASPQVASPQVAVGGGYAGGFGLTSCLDVKMWHYLSGEARMSEDAAGRPRSVDLSRPEFVASLTGLVFPAPFPLVVSAEFEHWAFEPDMGAIAAWPVTPEESEMFAEIERSVPRVGTSPTRVCRTQIRGGGLYVRFYPSRHMPAARLRALAPHAGRPLKLTWQCFALSALEPDARPAHREIPGMFQNTGRLLPILLDAKLREA